MNKIIVLYPFLFGLFPILFLYAKNISEVPLKKFFKFLFSYILIYISIYSALFYVFKNLEKSSFLFFMLTVFFYHSKGPWDKILTQNFNKKINNIFLLSSMTAPILLINYLPLPLIGKIIFWATLFFNLIPFLNIVSFMIKVNSITQEETSSPETHYNETVLPDIYYIIPDTYAGDSSLRKYLNFDNSEFLNFLKEKGFNVFDNATSNYSLTNLSLASTLNINYIHTFFNIDKSLDDVSNMFLLSKPYFSNFVVNFLRKKGYTFIHLVNYWEKQLFSNFKYADIEINLSESNDFEKAFFNKTIIAEIANKFLVSTSKKGALKTLNCLEGIYKEKSPKFVYTHLICPHSPYYFDEDGKTPDKKTDEKVLYINQLKYLNKRLMNTVENILSNNKSSIIIIQSDHGSEFNLNKNSTNWDNPDIDCYKERFDILRAIYLPNNKSLNINFKTSVNIFRAIFNECFNERYEMLEDKIFYSNYKERFNLKEITNEIL